jgi:hypothetical protein
VAGGDLRWASVVVLDNAGYNRWGAVRAYLAKEGCRIQLVLLPGYAPNLNLIERLWRLLKKSRLWNEHYLAFASFEAAIDGFFRNLGSCREQLAPLITDHLRSMWTAKSQPPQAEGYLMLDGSISQVAVQRSAFFGLLRDGGVAKLIATPRCRTARRRTARRRTTRRRTGDLSGGAPSRPAGNAASGTPG